MWLCGWVGQKGPERLADVHTCTRAHIHPSGGRSKAAWQQAQWPELWDKLRRWNTAQYFHEPGARGGNEAALHWLPLPLPLAHLLAPLELERQCAPLDPGLFQALLHFGSCKQRAGGEACESNDVLDHLAPRVHGAMRP